MKKALLIIGLALVHQLAEAQTAFTPGNLAVIRAINVSADDAKSAEATIDEYDLTGAFVRTHPMPTVASGANRAFVFAGLKNVEGLSSLSPNRQYLTFCGFDAATGASSVGGTSSATTNRVVAVVDAAGNINTKTSLDIFSGQTIRSSAIANNGTDIWIMGGNSGINYIQKDATSGQVVVAASPTNGRDLKLAFGQLYVTTSSSSPANTRLGTVGSGTPTSTGNTVTQLNGVSFNSIINGFVFLDSDNNNVADLLYLGDETNGIVKYSSENTTTWTYRSAFAVTGSGTIRGLTGNYINGKVNLYATLGAVAGNTLIKVEDTAAPTVNISGTQTLLATADANSAFKSVSFTPGTTDVSLPVKLTVFQGKQQGAYIKLNWTTASEVNNARFELLRSNNGLDFSSIGQVIGHGNSNNINHYSFIDEEPTTGTNYYQLNQVDFDGGSQKSNIIAVKSDLNREDLTASITENQLNVSFYSAKKTEATFILTDLTGKRIVNFSVSVEKGHNDLNQSLNNLQSGIYILTLVKDGGNTSIKLLK